MPTAPEDWSEILDRLLAGDRLAFLKLNRLVTGFLVQLRAYDFREEWEDLRQEVLLSLVANARAGRLREPEKIVAYARIITRNKFIDRIERQQRRREKQAVPWDEEAAARSGAALGFPGQEDHRAADLWLEVSGLSTQQQRVLEGVYRQGKTVQQVADETGIPLGTAKRRLREALFALRERLRDAAGGG